VYSLTYQHFKYFWAVSRHGNLTRASAKRFLTPQTVSTWINDLEKGLGVEVQDVVRDLPDRACTLSLGSRADIISKLIRHHLIELAICKKIAANAGE
jgi:putative heme iron utilization protein